LHRAATGGAAERRRACAARSFVKDADRDITAELRAAGRLVDAQTITHSYPFCWRSETPLIYKVQMRQRVLQQRGACWLYCSALLLRGYAPGGKLGRGTLCYSSALEVSPLHRLVCPRAAVRYAAVLRSLSAR